MAKISGSAGALTISGGTAFVLTKWEVKQTAGIQDVTDSSSGAAGWREKIPNGFKDWKGSAEGFVNSGTADPVPGGAAAACVFTAKSGVTWTGNGIITRVGNALQVAGETAVTVAIEIEGAGALTAATA
jgi:hypothetical protein